MKKAKTKSPTEKDISYQKPALRSEAFARALSEAKLRVVGSGGLRSLFEKSRERGCVAPEASVQGELAVSSDDAAAGPRVRARRIQAGFE